jgi:serine/threonine protein kinase
MYVATFYFPEVWVTNILPLVHLERKGYIEEEVVRFWVAELASGLEYLHGQRIIHRYINIFHVSTIF